MAVARIAHPELFFGLVAPVGVDLDMIIEVLTTELILQKYIWAAPGSVDTRLS